MSSGTFFWASFLARSERLRARPVSWSSRILRATASGSASGPRSCSEPVGSEIDAIRVNDLGRGLSRGVQGRADAELLQDALLDLVGQVGVVLEELARVLLALTELVALVGVPSAGLADDPLLDTDVDQATLAGDALAVHDVELGLLERRRDLVLHDLDPGPVADHVGAVLEGLDAAYVQTDRGVELQCLATRGGLRRTEHHADLLAQLVDEDHRGVGVVQRTGHLAQRLAHQPGLQTDVAVAHLALDLGAGHQRRNGV